MYFFYRLVCCFVLLLSAHAAGKQPHHSYVGSHGMLVFQSPAGKVFTSHLPLYHAPHDQQIIYQVTLPEPLSALINSAGLFTLLPDVFDLRYLMDAKRLSVNAKLYAGHFERGGQMIAQGTIMFERAVYIRPLTKNTQNGFFERVELDNEFDLLIHKIGPSPSVDALSIIAKSDKGSLFCDDLNINDAQALRVMLTQCLSSTLLYIETEDFAL